MPEYLSAKYLEPFITNELRNKFSSAFSYVSTTGTVATGVDATVLTDICDVYITAEKKLKNNLEGICKIDTDKKNYHLLI